MPDADRSILRTHGLKITTLEQLPNEAGSPGIYDPNLDQISIGEMGFYRDNTIQFSTKNNDPGGTLRHEIGHALYKYQRLDQWQAFQTLYNKEMSQIPVNELDRLQHFTGSNGPSETFAELYAAEQGRTSNRVSALSKAFPELLELVKTRFSRNR